MSTDPDVKQELPPSYEDATGTTNSSTEYPAPLGGVHNYGQPAPQVYTPGLNPPTNSSQGYAPGQAYTYPPGYQYQGTSTVVVHQPTFVAPQTTVVPDNMSMAICATLCCFWPLGIMAIVKSNESRNALARNDIQAALTLAQDSRRLSCMSIGGGVIMWIIVIIIVIVAIVM